MAAEPYVPKYQIAMKQRVFPMSLSGKLVSFGCFSRPNMPMTMASSADPKIDVPALEVSPDWKDGLLQDPGV